MGEIMRSEVFESQEGKTKSKEWKNLNLMIIAGNNFLGIEKIVKFCYTFTRWEILQIWNFLVDYFCY